MITVLIAVIVAVFIGLLVHLILCRILEPILKRTSSKLDDYLLKYWKMPTRWIIPASAIMFTLSVFTANIGHMSVGMYTHCVGFFFFLGLAGIVARKNWLEAAMSLLWRSSLTAKSSSEAFLQKWMV